MDKKGLIYHGNKVLPYCPRCGTSLSSHEVAQGYKDVKEKSAVVRFRVPSQENTYIMAWTTTPWTLPSNVALCVGPKIEYVAVQTYNSYTGEKMTVVLAKNLLYSHFNKKAEDIALEDYKPGDKLVPFKVVGEYKGPELVGMEYEQLIPWVKPVSVDENGKWSDASDKAFRIIPGDYVTTEDGTGIVHIAPTFGADDAFVAKAAGIPSLFMINKFGETRPMVDLTGKFYKMDELDEEFVKECIDVEAYKEFEGRWVKNAYDPQFTVNKVFDEKAAAAAETLDIQICLMMKGANKAFKIEKHTHNYPHCWRTDKPVLYYPLDSWFIRTTAVQDELIALNKTINWKPESTGTGRFGKWLENLQDWNLSRHRHTGNMARSMHPAYHLYLSTRDMARIGYLMLRKGKWEEKQIIAKDWHRKMIATSTKPEETGKKKQFGYGYMWWLYNDSNPALKGAYAAHGAMGQYITIIPELDMVIAHKTDALFGRKTKSSRYQRFVRKVIATKEQ